jgi:hypothetical protein
LFSACCSKLVRLLGREDYHCRVSLPLACFGCRSRVALCFARVFLVYSSCYVRVALEKRIHIIGNVVVLRSCAWMVVLFGSMGQKSLSPKKRPSPVPISSPVRSLPILAPIALSTCCRHCTRSSQLLHLYGCSLPAIP